ncbi:hypoxia induced protein conserved region-domain-containing protein [Collybia nuda]|uniref:Hypoxia induced protein conserved region-domain-containing protein n=1 Tax=Collybia nuda TaxID=64659 RepID=A0A9P5YEC0_9AGAR|nr:hypoxia induced protein conserved region-domain-containing protein [Collybia nuda]
MVSQVTTRPPPLPGYETYQEKATRKFKENPWVPLGSMATVGALIVAMVKMRRGQSKQFNHWLRVRVAAQGLTIVALVAGTYSLRPKDTPIDDPTLTRNDVDVERRRLEKLAKEKDEFEERMRDAEVAQEVENSFLQDRRKARTAAKEASSAPTPPDVPAPTTGGGQWWGWFGGSGTKSTPSAEGGDSNKKP